MIRMKSQDVTKENSGFWSIVAQASWENIIGESDPYPNKLPEEKKPQCL